MKQQILLINGGTTFESKKEYLSFLKGIQINLEKMKAKLKWKDVLAKRLGGGFEVFIPKMPNSTNASYKEWKIWFSKIIELLDDNLILIGHSLGGIFLVKYLSENIISKKIKTTILIAAPFDSSDSEESLNDFVLGKSLKNFEKQASRIYLFQSRDDKVVNFDQVKKYKKKLPNAKLKGFRDRGHFNQDTFPEIIDLLKKEKNR